jgi:hypothetical protein
LLTGLLAGFALPLALVPILNGQLWTRPGRGRVLEHRRDALAWLASIPVAFGVVRWALPLAGVVYPVLVSAAIVATFTSVNVAIVCLLRPFENRYERLREAWVPLLIGMALTIGELWLTGLLRDAVERAAGLV